MNYFETLPKLLQPDNKGNVLLVNNILTRSYILPKLSNNINLFYKYDIKEGDTPDNLAYRYYNDVNRYWMIMYANNILDPLSDWPMESRVFDKYLIKKYKQAAANLYQVSVDLVTDSQVISYVNYTTHHYEQTTRTTDSSSDYAMEITTQIDENTYWNSVDTTTSATFNNGITVTKSTTKRAVSIFDYEQKLDEDKRTINLMKDVYANDAEQQLKTLMSQ